MTTYRTNEPRTVAADRPENPATVRAQFYRVVCVPVRGVEGVRVPDDSATYFADVLACLLSPVHGLSIRAASRVLDLAEAQCFRQARAVLNDASERLREIAGEMPAPDARVVAMPAPRSDRNRAEFDALVAEAEAMQEDNDCAVKAVALATGKTYGEAHAALADAGREHGKATSRDMLHSALAALGYVALPYDERAIIADFPGVHATLKGLTTRLCWRHRRTDRDVELREARRAKPICDGKTCDYSQGRAMRVVRGGLFEVLPLSGE